MKKIFNWNQTRPGAVVFYNQLFKKILQKLLSLLLLINEARIKRSVLSLQRRTLQVIPLFF